VSGSSTPSVIAVDGISGSLSGGVLTLSLDRDGIAQLNGATFTGQIVAQGGLSGSLTTLSDGLTHYLKAGTGISLLTGSNGQIEISTNVGASSGLGAQLVLNDAPAGIQNGENLLFELTDQPADPNSFMLWLNGQLLTQGLDYTLAGKQINFVSSVAPEAADVLRAMYSKTVAAKIYAINAQPTQLVIQDSTMTGLTLPHDPDPNDSLMLFLNGQLLTQGNGNDYSLSGREVTFSALVEAIDVVRATYSYAV
jgi:hypothetical protein